jgi:predicted nucleotidyltransferase
MSSHTKSTGPIPLSKPRHTAIADVCQRHHVARMHAFGSVLRPDYRPGESDLDLLVEFQPSASRPSAPR